MDLIYQTTISQCSNCRIGLSTGIAVVGVIIIIGVVLLWRKYKGSRKSGIVFKFVCCRNISNVSQDLFQQQYGDDYSGSQDTSCCSQHVRFQQAVSNDPIKAQAPTQQEVCSQKMSVQWCSPLHFRTFFLYVCQPERSIFW